MSNQAAKIAFSFLTQAPRFFRAALSLSAVGCCFVAQAWGAGAPTDPVALQKDALAQKNGPTVTAVKLEQSPSLARLTFEMNETVDVRGFVLDAPERVIVDVSQTAFLVDPAIANSLIKKDKNPKLVQDFRFGRFLEGQSRIIIDIGRPVKIARASSERTPAGGAARLIVELQPTDPESFHLAAQEARAQELQRLEARRPPAPIAVSAQNGVGVDTRPVVAIDPGHGGVDTGAIAKEFLEKNLVFDFASSIYAALEARGRVKPVMTRSGDEFVPLSERVRIAQSAHAGLLVSVHADTLRESNVRGATVYTLSDKASDAEAARIAASENGADLIGALVEKEDSSEVSDILADLTRRETRTLSHLYARSLVGYWRSTSSDLNKNPMRSAGFRVLKGIDTPSVLLELGYMSSPSDLERLSSSQWRQQTAAKVAESIERFFEEGRTISESALAPMEAKTESKSRIAGAENRLPATRP